MDDSGLEAIQQAAGDVFDGQVMVEGFVLIATAVEADTGERVWAIRSDPDASVFVTMGLAALNQRFLDDLVQSHLGYIDGDQEE